MLSSEQKTFIDLCVFKHGGNVERTRMDMGILPRDLRAWFNDPEFDAEMQRMSYVCLRMSGLDMFGLVHKLMLIINADVRDLANIDSVRDLDAKGASVSYPIQSIKRMFSEDGALVSVEVKHHDKLKALLAVLEKILPKVNDAARNIGGGPEDARLDGVSVTYDVAQLEKHVRALLPKSETIEGERVMSDAEIDAWLGDA